MCTQELLEPLAICHSNHGSSLTFYTQTIIGLQIISLNIERNTNIEKVGEDREIVGITIDSFLSHLIRKIGFMLLYAAGRSPVDE